MYLLDTNTVIYFFKDLGNVAEKLLSKSPQEIAIPSIALYKLEIGIVKSNNPQRRKQQLNSLLSHIEAFSFTSKEARLTASIRAELERAGRPQLEYMILLLLVLLSALIQHWLHITRESLRGYKVKKQRIGFSVT